MLILGRRVGESIVLTVPPSDQPTRIVLTVASIKEKGMRLGIEAPRVVDVLRSELEKRGPA